ncbi:MAG TPA: ABC transporter permease [Ktedonobacterales bacterium]
MAVVSRAPNARSAPIYDSGAFRIPVFSELAELARYRYLIWNMVVRDLRIRYKRSVLGFVWVTLNPLLQMGVLYIVFSQIFRFGVQHFAVYLLGGILIWGLFGQGSSAAMVELVNNAAVLRKLYVPPSTFVTAAIGSALLNLIFSLAPFVLLAALGGIYPSLAWLYTIVPIIQVTIFTFGVGLIVSALYVFFRDISEIYQVLVNAYYYATPIFYPLSVLPEPMRSWERYNPMYLYISSFRDAVMSGIVPPLGQIVASSLLAVGVLIIGWVIFTRVENRFVYHL